MSRWQTSALQGAGLENSTRGEHVRSTSIVPEPALGSAEHDAPTDNTRTDGGWDAVPSFREIRWILAPLPAADTLSTTDAYRHLAQAAVESLHELHGDHRKLQASNARLLTEFRDVRASRSEAA